MTDIFKPFEKRKLTAKNKALLEEWKGIHEFCKLRNDISYAVVKYNRNDLPEEYEITYKIPSFVALDKDKKIENGKIEQTSENEKLMFYPAFGEVHRMQVTIPPSFPQINGKPKGIIRTPIWHPNIVCHGDENIVGRVCFNEGNLDASVTIVDRIAQVADYLSYKNYLAVDREPYPYDLDVAMWIREVAEPMGWVAPGHGINYELFGVKIADKHPVNINAKKESKPREEAPADDAIPHTDSDIVILDEEDENYSFREDFIEREAGGEAEGVDEVFEL